MAVLTVGSFSLKGWKRYALLVGGIVVILLSSHITIESARDQQANDKRIQENDKKLDDVNRQLVNTKNQLDSTNDKLDNSNEKLDEILQIVKRNNPELEGLDSVDSIIAALKSIESRTSVLEVETQKTVFILGDRSVKQLPNGTFETKFNLVPIGSNIIPRFKVGCQTRNNAKIMDIIIHRKNTPLTGTSSPYSSPDKTSFDVEILNSIEPGILNVFVLTDKEPGRDMLCGWSPR